jgi:hypothetical protein
MLWNIFVFIIRAIVPILVQKIADVGYDPYEQRVGDIGQRNGCAF